MKRSIALRIVVWPGINNIPQINSVCTNCLCSMNTYNLYDVVNYWTQHECPNVLPFETKDFPTNINLGLLRAALEKQ